MSNSIGVDPIIIFAAFRYALGRMTFIVSDVSDCIERNADKIPRADRGAMIREIAQAIREGQAGMPMDVEIWQRVEARLRRSLNDA